MPVYYKYKFIFYFNVTVAIVFILIYVHFYWYFSSVYKIVLHIYEAHFFISCYVRVVCAGIHRADLKLIKLLIMTPQRTNETVVSLSPLLFFVRCETGGRRSNICCEFLVPGAHGWSSHSCGATNPPRRHALNALNVCWHCARVPVNRGQRFWLPLSLIQLSLHGTLFAGLPVQTYLWSVHYFLKSMKYFCFHLRSI